MTTTYLAPDPIQSTQLIPGGNTPANGGKLFFYAAGSSTKQTVYKDSAGAVQWSNPIVLDSGGNLPSGGVVWFASGQTYKVVFAPSTDTDPPVSPYWTKDNLAGINDTSSSQSEWVSGPTPTFVNTTSFTLSGDQTSTFQLGRRLKTTNTGGTIYSTIIASAFGALTTITVLNDSGVLDSGLSAVSYALLSDTSPSLPGFKMLDGYAPQASTGSQPVLWQMPPLGSNLIGGYLDWTVAGNVLTVAVKTWAGNDPSAIEPVAYPVRDATASTGSLTYRKLTAATSISINDTALLGTVNSIAFRIWAVIFNDGGTDRLAVINCVTTSANAGSGRNVDAIYPLGGWGIASATLEDNASDSAQIFYSNGASVTAKAYATLGYATWESGLATAGTWSAGPTRKQLFGPGVPLPGQTIQVQVSQTGALATGTTVIPDDDTIPQITEGDQYLSQAITPSSAANSLQVNAQGTFSNSAGGICGLALFQDATANALGSARHFYTNVDQNASVRLENSLLTATSTATTLRIRAGSGSAGTTTFNGTAGARKYGGVLSSFLKITEVMG